jgi:16S rRNA (uracil1498-N3)-methyltransferase
MTRSGVRAVLQTHEAVERELGLHVTLAVGMPANDRMDDLVEKATELGAAGIVPLMCERSVLRLSGERAAKRVAHWQAVAVAACEQSGRNRVPRVHGVRTLEALMAGDGEPGGAAGLADASARWQLSLAPSAVALREAWSDASSSSLERASAHILILSGPEGGLSTAEQEQAMKAGFQPVSLGPRTLRADTAPLAALAALGVLNPLSRSKP